MHHLPASFVPILSNHLWELWPTTTNLFTCFGINDGCVLVSESIDDSPDSSGLKNEKNNIRKYQKFKAMLLGTNNAQCYYRFVGLVQGLFPYS